MASDITLTSVLSDTQSTSQQSVTLANDFSDFLTLLTTQLQNQDPLAPMDSTEFTNQLVQFSQVEQSINTNQKLDSLVQMQMSALAGMSLSFVGMEVTYPSSDLYYDGEDTSKITYVFDQDTTDATLNVYDSEGAIVYTATVAGDTGTNTFEWDGSHQGGGKVDTGTYSIVIDGFNSDGEAVSATTVVSGVVSGVETQNGIPYLLVGDRAVQQTTVINAKTPTAITAADTTDTEDDTTDTTDTANNTGTTTEEGETT